MSQRRIAPVYIAGVHPLTPAAARRARLALETCKIRGPALADKRHPRHPSLKAEHARLLEIETRTPHG
jgi:hypothetical protein